MDVTTAAHLGMPRLGHEGDGFALLRGDLLDTLFEQHVHVGHRQRLVVHKIDFVLAAPPFPLAGFHRHARAGHGVAHRAQQRFIARRLHGVIINPVIARRNEIPVITGEGVLVTLVEEEKFQFAGDGCGPAPLGQGVNLPVQDGTRASATRRPSACIESHSTSAVPACQGSTRSVEKSGRISKSPKPLSQLASWKPSIGSISMFTVSR